MPEGPEVRLTTDFLHKYLEGQIIYDWVFTEGQYKDIYPTGYDEFYESLPLIIQEVGCKGKTIYFIAFNEFKTFYIVHSLIMTGRWQLYKDDYCKWYITYGDDSKKLWFRNPRCLATLDFLSSKLLFDNIIDNLGPDILTEQFSLSLWKQMITKHKNKNVTSFLMDQNILSGIGNYLKAEVLYYARIDPLRKVKTITESESEKLYEGIRIISRISYNSKGLSLKDFTDEKGHKGSFEFKLKIYGKPWAHKTKTSDGRTTYWDPCVQV